MTQLIQGTCQRHAQAAQRAQDTKPYLLLDAGGTVVFPDQDIILNIAHRFGIKLSQKNVYRGYYQVIYQLDLEAKTFGKFPEPWPDGYAGALFKVLGIHSRQSQQAAAAIHQRHIQHNLWTFTFPWVREALDALADCVSGMSILSNSDGRTKQVFSELGMDHYFDLIFDSEDLGLEKPDPKIFNQAIDRLGLNPEQVIYIGDIYALDVVGANQAGLSAVHIDPFRFYDETEWPGSHITNITHLPQWLKSQAETLFRPDRRWSEFTKQSVHLPNHAGV
jgi:putative hydrolase of the HAD superfamily